MCDDWFDRTLTLIHLAEQGSRVFLLRCLSAFAVFATRFHNFRDGVFCRPFGEIQAPSFFRGR